MRFNLVDEPWIPCEMDDGALSDLSLSDIFARPQSVRAIVDPSPLVVVAVLRLLLAICHRVLPTPDADAWAQLWEERPEVAHRVGGYLSHWRSRFDLFDEKRPFLQVPRMADAREHVPHHLMLEAASGNNATLFDHHHEEDGRLMPAAHAARYLLAQRAYAIGFGKSRPFYFCDAPLVRGATVLLLGRNLLETLLLNLVRYDPRSEENARDMPEWERVELRTPVKDGTLCSGYLDYLTWPSRRIHLIADLGPGPAKVRGCQIQQGLKLKNPFNDPFMAYERDEKRGRVPVMLSRERATWRDSGALLGLPLVNGLAKAHHYDQPEIFRWLAYIANNTDAAIPSFHVYSVHGLATDPGKAASVVMWRQERLPLPLRLLTDEDTRSSLAGALVLANRVAQVLFRATARLAQVLLDNGRGRKDTSPSDGDEMRALVRHLGVEPVYWSRLADPFRQMVCLLATDVQGSAQMWKAELETAARKSFGQTMDAMDRSARALKAMALAEGVLSTGLKDVLKEVGSRAGAEMA